MTDYITPLQIATLLSTGLIVIAIYIWKAKKIDN